MSSRAQIYELLSKYVKSTNTKTKQKIESELRSMKKDDPHKLLEHDEYFHYKNDNDNTEDFEGFILSNNQKFLKQFMSLNTTNKALLLFHGVGVGKTCSAIHIAQNMNMKRADMKRTIVITPKLLASNFKKELFDKSRIDNSCLGNFHVKNVPNFEKLSKKQLEKEAQLSIKSSYEFYGYLEFSNEVSRNKKKDTYEKYIQDTYSNRLIIVDEVHNIRVSTSEDSKKLPGILEDIYRYASNVRILFLSATPMYNEYDEIIWMMRLFLKDPNIQSADIFDKNNEIKKDFKKMLVNFSQNYVSFMRGENPIDFPARLLPSVNNDENVLKKEDYPDLDVYNEEMPDTDFGEMEIIASHFSPEQLSAYKTIPYKSKNKEENEYESADVQKRIQLANIYYPSKDIVVGKAGLKTLFHIDDNGRFKLKQNKIDIFSRSNISRYSPKINTIIQYIKSSTGIVIVYSKYIYSGLIPLVLALESEGYNRFEEPNLWKNKSETKGNYILLTGDKLYSKNNDKYITMSKSPSNKNGDQIKIILMSAVATEGVDFKNVREIHILEPWYNMSQIEQITGRGVRKNSHIDLIESKRNTTIYLHANMISNEPIESVDFRMYRTSMLKQLAISKLERIIKASAIDCNLNQNVNHYPTDFKKVDLVTSQNTVLKNYAVGDRDNTRICDYTKCRFKCNPIIEKEPKFINNTELISYDIGVYVKEIVKIFEKTDVMYMTYDAISKHFKNTYILDHALNHLTHKKNKFTVKGVKGKFLYKSNKYMFLPEYLEDDKVILSYKNYIDGQVPKSVLLNTVKSTVTKTKRKKTESDSINVKELLKRLEKYLTGKIDHTTLYAMVFDNMNRTDQMSVIYDVLNKSNLSENMRSMLNDSGIVTFENELIVSYIDIYNDELFKRNGDKFIKASPIEKEQNRKAFRDKHLVPFLSSKRALYGYIEINQKKKMSVFKMANRESLKNNKRKSIIGTVCHQTSQISNSLMKTYLEYVDLKIKGKPTKSELCLLYEYGLRLQNLNFLRPRHFNEYKHFSKKN